MILTNFQLKIKVHFRRNVCALANYGSASVFKRLTNERGAQSRLDDILDGETRNVVAKNNIEELVRSSNRKPELDSIGEVLGDSLAIVFVGRDKMQNMILASANKQAVELGIKILDFRFKE